MKFPGLAFWSRALAAWGLIAAAETVHGILRGRLLVPAVGEAAARTLTRVPPAARVRGAPLAGPPQALQPKRPCRNQPSAPASPPGKRAR
jgi:hypothetical protein